MPNAKLFLPQATVNFRPVARGRQRAVQTRLASSPGCIIKNNNISRSRVEGEEKKKKHIHLP